VLHQECPTFCAGCTELAIRRLKGLAGLCLTATPPERCIGPPETTPALDRVEAVDADEGSCDFVEEADAGGEGTVAHADNVAGHEDRVVVAGAGGVGVIAEDAPVHFAFAGKADEFSCL